MRTFIIGQEVTYLRPRMSEKERGKPVTKVKINPARGIIRDINGPWLTVEFENKKSLIVKQVHESNVSHLIIRNTEATWVSKIEFDQLVCV